MEASMPGQLSEEATRRLEQLERDGRKRRFTCMAVGSGMRFPERLANGLKAVNFSSNDYLGMSQRAGAIEAGKAGFEKYGVGAGGSRNIGGTLSQILDLENELANLHHVDGCVTFTSGYEANRNAIVALFTALSPTCHVQFFSDEENHASIIDGMQPLRLGHAKFVFSHNDLNDLERQLAAGCEEYRESNSDKSLLQIIVIESIYSMSGSKAPLGQIIHLAKRRGCAIVLNEVHAVGVVGTQGRGYLDGVEGADNVDLVLGTLGKGFGAQGGYVAGKSGPVELIRQYARGFIFTTAISPGNVAAALSNVTYLRTSDIERQALAHKLAYFINILEPFRDRLITNDTHILPLLIGDESEAKNLASDLLSRGIYVTPVTYPTVPRGQSRLRVTVTPLHSERQMDYFAKSLASCMNTAVPKKPVVGGIRAVANQNYHEG